MTRQTFESIFQKLRNHFATGPEAFEIEEYFDKFSGLYEPANFQKTVNRAIQEFRHFPTVDELYEVFLDLTYWDPSDFMADWSRAYHECTGQTYGMSMNDEESARGEHEYNYWISGGKKLIQRFAFEKGGRRAVQSILKDYAARGYLVDRKVGEFIAGKHFGPADGWVAPRLEPLLEIPVREIVKQVGLGYMPPVRLDLEEM
ncbi:MAG: hypothetical protein WC891_08650 [Actinomycetota bacterium]